MVFVDWYDDLIIEGYPQASKAIRYIEGRGMPELAMGLISEASGRRPTDWAMEGDVKWSLV